MAITITEAKITSCKCMDGSSGITSTGLQYNQHLKGSNSGPLTSLYITLKIFNKYDIKATFTVSSNDTFDINDLYAIVQSSSCEEQDVPNTNSPYTIIIRTGSYSGTVIYSDTGYYTVPNQYYIDSYPTITLNSTKIAGSEMKDITSTNRIVRPSDSLVFKYKQSGTSKCAYGELIYISPYCLLGNPSDVFGATSKYGQVKALTDITVNTTIGSLLNGSIHPFDDSHRGDYIDCSSTGSGSGSRVYNDAGKYYWATNGSGSVKVINGSNNCKSTNYIVGTPSFKINTIPHDLTLDGKSSAITLYAYGPDSKVTFTAKAKNYDYEYNNHAVYFDYYDSYSKSQSATEGVTGQNPESSITITDINEDRTITVKCHDQLETTVYSNELTVNIIFVPSMINVKTDSGWEYDKGLSAYSDNKQKGASISQQDGSKQVQIGIKEHDK